MPASFLLEEKPACSSANPKPVPISNAVSILSHSGKTKYDESGAISMILIYYLRFAICDLRFLTYHIQFFLKNHAKANAEPKMAIIVTNPAVDKTAIPDKAAPLVLSLIHISEPTR